MIITKQKNDEEILKSVQTASGIFIVGCGSCATKCGTGDDKAAGRVKELLEKNGKRVSGSIILDSACDMRIAKKDLLKNDAFVKADTVLVLACGAGNQSIGQIFEKVIVPALESQYVGSTERIGVYKKFCGICGECILIETQGICPRTRCPKGLVNGPCGGFVNGKCETDQTKDCAWVLIFERLKKQDKTANFLKQYIKPKANE